MDNHIKEFEEILKTKNITSLFQPIVCLKDGNIIGYESLSRGPKHSPLHSPSMLIEIATQTNKLWELELVFRSKAMEKAQFMDKDKLLFLNVDPNIIKNPKFKEEFTQEFLDKVNISPQSIIFELTERTAIEDYKIFNEALKNYTSQGYQIAIDDTGVGYSGIKTIAETHPHYIKIDKDLIEDIERDLFKQSIIKCFVSLTNNTNIQLIAEGIETPEQLKKLIQLGVSAGQGFFIKRPCENFDDIPLNIKNVICKEYNSYKKHLPTRNKDNKCIGAISSKLYIINDKKNIDFIKEYMKKNNLNIIGIEKDGTLKGLICEDDLNLNKIKLYKPLSIINYYTNIHCVVDFVLNSNNINLSNVLVIYDNSNGFSIVSIKKLFETLNDLSFTKIETVIVKG